MKDWRLRHGEYGSRLYFAWDNMLQRCNNPKASYYHRYGGRGITVCESWRADFRLFKLWAMSHGYQDDLTIDRINSDKGYSPKNCRWVTWSVQGHNKKPSSKSGFKGVYANKARWCAKISIKSKMVHLGTFDTSIEAARAYNEAAQKVYGELVRLNTFEEV